MKKTHRLGRLFDYILYNIYFEMLFLYLLLFSSFVMPIFAMVIVIAGRIIKNIIRTDFIYELARIVSRLLYTAEDKFLLISTSIILVIIILISFKRMRKGIFSDSFLLLKIFRNYNGEFRIFSGLYLPFVLIALYLTFFFYEGTSIYFRFIRLLIVGIIVLTLLNYAEQINTIMMNIKEIGTYNRRTKKKFL